MSVYKLVCDSSDKIYIGSTKCTLEKRFTEHKSRCKDPRYNQMKLYSFMIEKGVEHFSIELIEETETFNDREKELISQLRPELNSVQYDLEANRQRKILYNRNRFQQKKETILAQNKIRYQKNKEVILQRCKEYREKNWDYKNRRVDCDLCGKNFNCQSMKRHKQMKHPI